ncbi:class F sortase [Amycolatopsis sp. NPDC059657]|uniref:class F sortase n=1 Tax=Amycolatopsis sp. NPDC059657 TaxID=3346899 RepID=UPI00366D3308
MKGFLVAVAAVAVLVSGCGGSAPEQKTAPTSQAVEQAAKPDESGKEPGVVTLPGGGVAKLVHQDLKDDGTLPIPEGLDEAAWWGSKVGADKGAALFSGHVNWKGKKGPFDELWRIKAGQDVSVSDAAGGKWTYKIEAVETVHKDKLAQRAEEFFSPDGPHRLVLVTCGGEYVGGSTGYEDNRIVTASLVGRP